MQEHPEVPEELGIEVGVRFRDQDFLDRTTADARWKRSAPRGGIRRMTLGQSDLARRFKMVSICAPKLNLLFPVSPPYTDVP